MSHSSVLLRRIGLTSLSFATALSMTLPAYADIADGRYGVNQVFDTQRSPAFPQAGSPFTLSGFKQPLGDNGGYDINTGYVSLFYTSDNDNLVGIKLYDANGNETDTVTAKGSVYGLEQDGFLYVSNAGTGTYISNNEGFNYGEGTTYTPSKTGTATLEELKAYMATTRILGPGQTPDDLPDEPEPEPLNILSSAASNSGNRASVNAAQSLEDYLPTSGDIPAQIAFASLSTDEERAQAVERTLPVATSGTTNAVLGTIGTVNQIVQARTSTQTGLSSGNGIITKGHIWFKPFYSRADQDSKNGISGYETDNYGAVAGYDRVIFNDFRLGVALSYGTTDVETNNGLQNVDVDSYKGLVYGSYAFNPATEMNVTAGAGYHKNDSSRLISIGGLNRVATADYDSWSAHAGTGVGHVIKLNDKLQLIPRSRIDYRYIKNEGYTESGGGSLSLDADDQTTEQLIPKVTGKINYNVTNRLSMNAKAGAGYDLLSERASVTALYVGGGPAFTTEGIDPSPWRIESGFGINYRYNDKLDVHVGYNREDWGSDFTNQSVTAKLRMNF